MKEVEDIELGEYSFVPKPFSKKFNSYEEMVEYTGIDYKKASVEKRLVFSQTYEWLIVFSL